MTPSAVAPIPALQLALAFLPVAVVLAILARWSLGAGTALYAVGRMLVQLLLIGYVLAAIFVSESTALVSGVLSIMLLASAWIAIRPLAVRGRAEFLRALGAIALGGVTTLALVAWGVLRVEPWDSPRHVIPLAGMIFANAMNTISIAAERYGSDRAGGADPARARRTALNAALIPVTNSLFAVGLVSLPGMMTGQILAGVEPTVAARYQIVVMCMIFGSAGVAAAAYLSWTSAADGLSSARSPDPR